MPTLGRIGAEFKLLASAKLAISTAVTTAFDFGTPDDVLLSSVATYKSGDRLLAIFRATAAAASSTIAFSVQDAPDSAGSIGTPATAITDILPAAVAGDTACVIGIQPQSGRPWLRLRATNSGTEAYTATCLLYALPNGV